MGSLAALVVVHFGLLVPLAWLISLLFADPVGDGVPALGVSSTEVAAVGLVAVAGGSTVLRLGALTSSLVLAPLAGRCSGAAVRGWFDPITERAPRVGRPRRPIVAVLPLGLSFLAAGWKDLTPAGWRARASFARRSELARAASRPA
jgi:hypothetical protein